MVSTMQPLKTTNGLEPDFQVEGDIVYMPEIRQGSGAEPLKHSRHFVVARRGQRWKIRTTNIKTDDFAYGDYYDEMACDGTIAYELRNFDETNPKISGVKDIITAQGRVRFGNTPVVFGTDFFLPLWIAYCSSDYFSSLKDNRIIAPLFTTRNFFTEKVPRTLALPTKWELNGSNFVSKIAWHSEGQYLHEDDRGSRIEKYPPPFDAGFLHATFETKDWVKLSEIFMPGSFVLNVFAPTWPEAGEPKCVLNYAAEAKARGVHHLQDSSFVPALTKKTRITDTRFRLGSGCGNHPTYASLTWMTENEVEAKCKNLGMKYEKQTAQN
jgi:hypothetical protein